MDTRKFSRVLTVCASLGILTYAVPPFPGPGWAGGGDEQLMHQLDLEAKQATIKVPGGPNKQALPPLRPVQRIPRAQFGVVGPFPLTANDLDALIFPDANAEERRALLEGLTFFSTPHTAAEGAGPDANQPFCFGCHRNSDEVPPGAGLVTTSSSASRAGRSSPTNFAFTSLDPTTGGGRAPDNDDAITNTGRTAAFTIFGDFKPSDGTFNGLAKFGGFVQHVRPTLAACLPDRIPPIAIDPNLGGIDPMTRLSATGFRRAVGERAAPPYVGRGLMEAVPVEDILALEDPQDRQGHTSSLDNPAAFLECPGDCISGRHNENPATLPSGFIGGSSEVRLGRFGLRAAGPTLMQFPVGGMQGEVGFTSAIRPTEINQADINMGRPGCVDPVSDPDAPVSTLFSLRSLMRLTTVPEFGDTLLSLLQSPDPTASQPPGSAAAKVQRGAILFGVDLVAFANRMIPGRIRATGDGLDPHAINQANRWVNCVGCHSPIHRTGESPADVGARLLRNVWAPIFSDLLIHKMTVIDAERIASTPRLPLLITRGGFDTLDIPRSGADDALPSQGVANGDEWRTPPLMGLGRIGPPFFHDARVYLSTRTLDSFPAGTVMTDSTVTNAPLVVRTLDDALRAAIELHDLPAPGPGCPVPPGGNSVGDVDYGSNPQDVICPPFDSETSRSNRSEAREVIRRYRALSPDDQQALIEFLKEL